MDSAPRESAGNTTTDTQSSSEPPTCASESISNIEQAPQPETETEASSPQDAPQAATDGPSGQQSPMTSDVRRNHQRPGTRAFVSTPQDPLIELHDDYTEYHDDDHVIARMDRHFEAIRDLVDHWEGDYRERLGQYERDLSEYNAPACVKHKWWFVNRFLEDGVVDRRRDVFQ